VASWRRVKYEKSSVDLSQQLHVSLRPQASSQHEYEAFMGRNAGNEVAQGSQSRRDVRMRAIAQRHEWKQIPVIVDRWIRALVHTEPCLYFRASATGSVSPNSATYIHIASDISDALHSLALFYIQMFKKSQPPSRGLHTPSVMEADDADDWVERDTFGGRCHGGGGLY